VVQNYNALDVKNKISREVSLSEIGGENHFKLSFFTHQF